MSDLVERLQERGREYFADTLSREAAAEIERLTAALASEGEKVNRAILYRGEADEAFAKIVAEHEREACARIADEMQPKYPSVGHQYICGSNDARSEIASAIRARGKEI